MLGGLERTGAAVGFEDELGTAVRGSGVNQRWIRGGPRWTGGESEVDQIRTRDGPELSELG